MFSEMNINTNRIDKLINCIDNDDRISKEMKIIFLDHIHEIFGNNKKIYMKKELNFTELENKIIKFIQKKDRPVRTLLISEHIYGVDATVKMINKTLYEMKNKKYLIKETDLNNTKPKWKVNKDYIYS